MKTKHTPGPWGFTPTATLNDAPCRWEILGAGGVIAETNDSTTDANARLISAAPDMFDALQAIVDAYGDRDTLLIEQCKAALAKAKG
jgi:hypothetical protein